MLHSFIYLEAENWYENVERSKCIVRIWRYFNCFAKDATLATAILNLKYLYACSTKLKKWKSESYKSLILANSVTDLSWSII